MTQIKSYKGKSCIEASVVRLPAKSSEAKCPIGKYVDTGTLILRNSYNIPFGEGQHLYLLSDEKIEGRGYRMDMNRMTVGVIDDDIYYNHSKNGNFKKIVATTDELLVTVTIKDDVEALQYQTDILLPRPSNSFLEAYVKAQGKIDKVLIEVDMIRNMMGVDIDDNSKINYDESTQIKIAPDNTVSIHPVEEKTYTTEEVKQLLWKCYVRNYKPMSPDDISNEVIPPFNKWVEENL